MVETSVKSNTPAPLVALAGWLVPGAGYVLLGQRARGYTIGIAIVALFVMGILIGGVRVVDVPGYDRAGLQVRVSTDGRRLDSNYANTNAYQTGKWTVTSRAVLNEIINKPWYIPQVLAGPMNLIASWGSVATARAQIAGVHGRLWDIGTLYTAVAGMLNLLAIIDSAYRASEAR